MRRFSEMSMMVESLPIFYTQRDNLFYSAWAFALPTTLLRIPYSLLESFLWSIIVYWSVGLAPSAGRFFTFWLLLFLSHQVSPLVGFLPGHDISTSIWTATDFALKETVTSTVCSSACHRERRLTFL